MFEEGGEGTSVSFQFTTLKRCAFSRAAVTLSLSASCSLTSSSWLCVPGVILTLILKRSESERMSLVVIDRPIHKSGR